MTEGCSVGVMEKQKRSYIALTNNKYIVSVEPFQKKKMHILNRH